MRRVVVEGESFPRATPDSPMEVAPGRLWQVLCGDKGHWRAGVFSPSASSAAECLELERHTCPELFVLLSGRVTLLLWREGKVEEVELMPERPILVTAPHSGYSPDGPYTGRAFVVERDTFETHYQSESELRAGTSS